MKTEKPLRIGLGTFDALKGLLIITVVMGHALSHYSLQDGILLAVLLVLGYFYSYGSLPAFYIIAGMFFKQKPVPVTMKKTAFDLMKPYVITGLFVAILFPIVFYIRTGWIPSVIQETPRWVLAYILGISTAETYVLGYRVYECYVAWFLPTMFLGLNFLNLILRIKNTVLRHLLVALCALVGYLLGRAGVVYFFVAQGLLSMSFCYIGYLGKQFGFFTSKKIPWWLIIGVIIIIAIPVGRQPFSIAYINQVESILCYFGSTGFAVLMILLAVRISNSKWNVPDWLSKVGMHSPWILCIHAVELTIFPWEKLREILSWPPDLVFLLEMLLKVMIILPCCVIIKKIVQRKYKRRMMNSGKL